MSCYFEPRQGLEPVLGLASHKPDTGNIIPLRENVGVFTFTLAGSFNSGKEAKFHSLVPLQHLSLILYLLRCPTALLRLASSLRKGSVDPLSFSS